MFLEQAALGAAALAGARKAAGVTQEQLAERTGLGVRTIRDLEAGRVQRPRRSTLNQLAAALDLDTDDSRWFVTSWTTRHSSASIFELLARGFDLDTLLALRKADGFREVALWTRAIIGPDRTCVSSRASIVMEAEHDGLAHRLLFWGRDDRELHNRGEVRLHDVSGCATTRPVLGTEHFAAFELSLPRALNTGELHSLSYEMSLDRREGPARVGPPITSDNALRGCFRPISLLAMHVQFIGCDPPARATEVRRTGTKPDEHVRELPVVGHDIQLVLRNLDAGVYGMSWEW